MLLLLSVDHPACQKQWPVVTPVSEAKPFSVVPLPPLPRATPLTDEQSQCGFEEPHVIISSHSVITLWVDMTLLRCCSCCCCCCHRRRRCRGCCRCARVPLSREPLKGLAASSNKCFTITAPLGLYSVHTRVNPLITQ